MDSLDAFRLITIYEWTFAAAVANLTIQIYRLVIQLTTFIFDIFKLSYGIDLFWPLTADDLKPYTQYFSNQDETIYKLAESFVLTVASFYGASSFLSYTITGLILYIIVFSTHSLVSIVGLFLIRDHKSDLISLEFCTWLMSICIEIMAVATTTYVLLYYGSLKGLTDF